MTQSSADTLPRAKGRILRFLRRAFSAVVILVAGFAIYAWATGARQEPIETGEPHMKAVVYTDYGSPDVLQIKDVKKPLPNDIRCWLESTRLPLIHSIGTLSVVRRSLVESA